MLTSSQPKLLQGKFRSGVVQRVVTRLRRWNNNRIAVNQLKAMPDYLLQDIGLYRYQIESFVNRNQQASVASIKPVSKPAVQDKFRDAA